MIFKYNNLNNYIIEILKNLINNYIIHKLIKNKYKKIYYKIYKIKINIRENNSYFHYQ